MYNLKIEKVIAKSPSEVFKALQEGKLFMNCSADSNSIDIDFRVGGKYKLDFKNHKVSNWGEFLEIVPNQKIVFTWCQTFGADQKPDTKVVIELFHEGSGTKLVLEHSGFKDQSNCEGHFQGWNGGIEDLSAEMEKGRIRLVRRYDLPLEQLYTIVQDLKSEFGKIQNATPNHSMLIEPEVTLTFTSRSESSSALEIIQGGLLTNDAQRASRKKWDQISTKISELI